MPSFYVSEVRKALVTIRNPNPIDLPCNVFFATGLIWWGPVAITIPGNSQGVVLFTVDMAQVGVGAGVSAKEVYVSVTDAAGKNILTAQGENLNLYAVGVELVDIVWT